MTKAAFIDKINGHSGLTKKQIDLALDAIVDILTDDVLKKGDSVNIPGLGVFKQKITAGRTGRNPHTGESLDIPTKTKLAFKQSSVLK